MSISNNRIKNLHEIDVIYLYLHKVKASGRWPVPPRFRLALFLQGKAIDEATTKPEFRNSPTEDVYKRQAFAEQLFAGNKNLNTVLTISLFYN